MTLSDLETGIKKAQAEVIKLYEHHLVNKAREG